MYVTINPEEGVWKLIPTNSDEEAFNAFVPTVLEPNSMFTYTGRFEDPENGAFLAIGICAVKKIKRWHFNLCFWCNPYPFFWYYTMEPVGEAQNLLVVGSEPKDKSIVSSMRNSIYFSGFSHGGLYFVRAEKINDKVVLCVCSNFCSLCGKGTLDVRESTSRVCNSCALECDHVFEKGYAHAPGIELATALVCQKCGSVDEKAPFKILSISA